MVSFHHAAAPKTTGSAAPAAPLPLDLARVPAGESLDERLQSLQTALEAGPSQAERRAMARARMWHRAKVCLICACAAIMMGGLAGTLSTL